MSNSVVYIYHKQPRHPIVLDKIIETGRQYLISVSVKCWINVANFFVKQQSKIPEKISPKLVYAVVYANLQVEFGNLTIFNGTLSRFLYLESMFAIAV